MPDHDDNNSNHGVTATRVDGSARPAYIAPLLAALALSVVLGAANLIMGDLNQDEGWYLYAAQQVAGGQLPYRDFAFTQGPMMPLVYSLFSPVIDAHGVGGGRALTWALGMAAAVLVFLTARRLGGASAGVLAFALTAVNVYQSYFTTVVKTYSLCALFLAGGVASLSVWVTRDRDRRHPGWLVLAGVGLALAAGTRLSAGVLLPVIGLWLLVKPSRWGTWSWLWFGLGGGVTLLVMFLPFALMAPEGFRFGLLEFHTLRDGGSLVASLVYKGGFVSRLVQAYFVAVALVILMAAAKIWRPFPGLDSGYHETDAFAFVRVLWISVIAVTLVHGSAPFPYDDYQVPVFPLLAIALGVSWAYALRAWSRMGYRWAPGVPPSDPPSMRWMVWSVVGLSAAAAFSSPINQDWMIAGRDRIWWRMKPASSLFQLREVARDIRREAANGLLLTQDTYLAVEAGLQVPPGWEMGPFSYYPELSDERAEALHLVNRRRLLETLSSNPATVAAFSGYGLAIASPEVAPLPEDQREALFAELEQRYEHVREVPLFGQAATTLRIYRLRDPP